MLVGKFVNRFGTIATVRLPCTIFENYDRFSGLSFFGSLISIMSNAINALITEQAPHILNQITTMGKIAPFIF